MWRYAYYILAAVNAITVVIGLFVHQQTVETLRESVHVREKWSQLEGAIKTAIIVFAKVSAPSNDIFESQDVKKEIDKLNTAYRTFQITINQTEQDLKRVLGENGKIVSNKTAKIAAQNIDERLKGLKDTVEIILKTTNSCLAEFQTGNKANAGMYLAKNQQLNAKANFEVLECLRLLNLIENSHVGFYTSKAESLKAYEFFLALVIAMIILSAVVYGVLNSRKTVQYEEGQALSKKILISDINELKIAKQEAERKETQIRQLLTYACNAFRIPLRDILGCTQSLLGALDETQHLHKVDAIKTAANNLLLSIKEILEFLKLESGMAALETNTFSVGEAILEAVNCIAPDAEKKQINVCLDLIASINHPVKGDKARLQQVFINLMGNAVKFTSIGGIGIKVIADKSEPESINFTFTVQDTGIGIADDKQAVIFEKFKHTDETDQQFGGLGLGLIVAKEIIALMSGDITIKSKEGEGSVFTVTITLKEQVGAIVPRLQRLDYPVLVLSDNQLNQQFLAPSISDITTKGSFSDKIEELAHFDPNAIIFISPSFASLPSVPEVLEKRLRNVLVLDMINNEALRSLCEEHHFAGYLHHPLTGEMLYKAISLVASDESTGEFIDNKRLLKKEKIPQIGGDNLSFDAEYEILVAEDNIINQAVIKAIFHKLGANVAIAQNGHEAFTMFKAKKYNLVFMNSNMPELNGIDATVLIREYEKNAVLERVPIVACTSNTSEIIHKSCIDSGMDDLIIKPMRIDEIFEKVVKWCKKL